MSITRPIRCIVEPDNEPAGSGTEDEPKENEPVCPACAGMIRTRRTPSRPNGCLPRMRGDDPGYVPVITDMAQFAPHARG